MKKVLTIIGLFTYFFAFSQEKNELSPCGTLTKHQESIFADVDFSRNSDDTILYVPMTLHLLANDNNKIFNTIRVLDAFNRLNTNYVDSKIRWFIEGDIRWINSTFWNNHKTIPEGWDMMKNNNLPNTINCYFVSNAAGNCGYNLPYGGVANARGCSGPADNTWAHELGHALRLPHPFLGWEGKTYDPKKPTPTTVTYDYTLFKEDSIILNQTIIDTAFVEMADGSNCAIAADRICDTKADYISQRWNCDSKKESPATYKDPNGKDFKVDGTLYMSYSDDACQNRFSKDEIAIMRSTLRGKKKNLLYNQVPGKTLPSNATVLVSPADKAKVAPDNVLLEWTKIDNAKAYVVEVSRLSSFSGIDIEIITDKNFVNIKNLIADKTYYWRARAFNGYDGGKTSERNSFVTTAATAVKGIDAVQVFSIYPNPVAEGNVTLAFEMEKNITGTVTVNDIVGKIIFQQTQSFAAGEHHINIAVENLPKGLYIATLKDNNGGIVGKKFTKE
jgi:Secretion system C-terminal sorting domain/Peptidase M66